MERKVHFIPKEYYHIYSRGVEKRKIFLEEKDYARFQALLYILNQKNLFYLSDFLKSGKRDTSDVYYEKRENTLVSILVYSLMPNHFHLVIYENEEGGISKFMGKLLTAYSMYFNLKHKRSGGLFVHPFRSEHISDDIYFKHIFSYIHLNCVDLLQSNWKEEGIMDKKLSQKFLEDYEYSSYPDFIKKTKAKGRNESLIIDFNSVPEFISIISLDISDFEKWFKGGLY
ncbi:hypothetical protein BH11PAT3_BH11PAT3_3140 [soil metagenome]